MFLLLFLERDLRELVCIINISMISVEGLFRIERQIITFPKPSAGD